MPSDAGLPNKCYHCGEVFLPAYDATRPGRMSCPACQTAYAHCGRCGQWVPEREWRDDVSMCERCQQSPRDDTP